MKDEYNAGVYEAEEYHLGGYPQLRKKRTSYAAVHKSQPKPAVNMLWGMGLFAVASVLVVGFAVCWLAC